MDRALEALYGGIAPPAIAGPTSEGRRFGGKAGSCYDEPVTDSSDKSPPFDRERSAKRVQVEAFVKVSGADREFVLRTRDLSLTGLFLYTKVAHIYPFKVGSTLNLELYDYDSFVSLKVVVVRVVEPDSPESEKYPAGFGARIVEVDDNNRQRLTSMLSRIQRSGGGELY
jgi:hypothetical protein